MISSHCYGMAWQHLMNLFMVGRFSETIWTHEIAPIFSEDEKILQSFLEQGTRTASKFGEASLRLMQNVAWRLIAFHRVNYSTLLCCISFLYGYRNIDNNIDNQCKGPMNNDKDCRVGEFTRSTMKLGQTKAIKSGAKHLQG